MNSESWRERAACRRMSTAEMYPAQYHRKQVEEVKYMCLNFCPVRAECAAYADAMETSYKRTWGIWGGETEQERIERRSLLKWKTPPCSRGRKRSYERHLNRNEPPCELCQEWHSRRQADEDRWEYARSLIRKGYGVHEITQRAGVHKDTVKRLREEMASSSI